MKPAPSSDRREAAPLIVPGDRLADIIAALATRMSEAQRHAFGAKMAELDRQRGTLSALSVTLGSA